MDPSSTFSQGKSFSTIEEVKACIKEFNERNFTNFVISCNNKKSIYIECKHGRERKCQSSGKRPRQHYNFLGCKASIRLFKSKNGSIKVTTVNLEHTNHEPTREIHEHQNATLDEEDRDLVLTLKEANTKPSQIKRVLAEKKNKQISTQRLRNLITKLLREESAQNVSSVEEFLNTVSSEGGTVRWTYDVDESVDSLFITSHDMKRKFIDSNPYVIQMDTTFNIEKGRYKLVAFCYLDSHSNKTEIGAFGLIASESESNFNFILSQFKALNNRNDYIFLVDKDFNSIDCVKRIFTDAVVLLCVFHVLKFMKNLVATAITTVDIKHDIFTAFKSLVYCPNESIFGEMKKTFFSLIKDIVVRRDQDYVSFLEYFKKNWEACEEMWVKFYRNSFALFGDHTTNRIERQFWSLKLSLSETFGTISDTVTAIIHLINFTNNRLSERRIFNATKSLIIYDADEFIHAMNKEASQVLNERGCVIFHRALKNLGERKSSMTRCEDGCIEESFKDGNSKVYASTHVTCDCTFRKEHRAPCHHILLVRKDDDNLPMFDSDLFDPKYIRKKVDESVMSPTDNDTHPLINTNENSPEDLEIVDPCDHDGEISLTDREKYKIIMPILTNLGNIVSCHSTKSFLNYVDEFKQIENLVRKGKSLVSKHDVHNTAHEENLRCTTTVGQTSNDIEFDIKSVNDENIPPNHAISDTQPATVSSPSNGEPSSEYKLKFKESLKTKGRPKKRSKQLSFNKTPLDKKKNKNPAKRKRVQDILHDMECYSENDEESNEPESTTPYNVIPVHEQITLSSTIVENNEIYQSENTNPISQSFSYLMSIENFENDPS